MVRALCASLLAFECNQVLVYATDAKDGSFLIADAPAAAFNKVLPAANIKLPPQPKDK